MHSDTDTLSPNKILVVKGQGIGPECIQATKLVLAATGVAIEYRDGSLGYPDAADLFPMLFSRAAGLYAKHFGTTHPSVLAAQLEDEAKASARAGGNVNDFYKKLLAKLPLEIRACAKGLIADLEKQTLRDAQHSDAVLKGALRTLDEGDEPSRNVTIRKAFEQYANMRRCVTLDPIAPGVPGADLLFVRENVEDLYASIEHRLSRNYPQALRHLTPEGCELILRAAFEAALRDGRKRVTALEKPNILKITGGLFKETFLRVAKDYGTEALGERAIEANFLIIDDGLAAIAAGPEKFDVVVTTNMFGDIGSDVAAKVTGGVGLVSSNNVNFANPRAVSMFETMGGTADDIAGQNKANPVALIDAAAEMLLHIGGQKNTVAAELIKAGVLEVLADGHYVGDVKKGPYQAARGKEKLGTQEFAAKIAEKISQLQALREAAPEKSTKQLVIARAAPEIRPLFARVLRSYEDFAKQSAPGSKVWAAFVRRTLPPNPVRARSRIVGFDMFVDDSGVRSAFTADGRVDADASELDPAVVEAFRSATGIRLQELFQLGMFGSIQSARSFGQYLVRVLDEYLEANPKPDQKNLMELLKKLDLAESLTKLLNLNLQQQPLDSAIKALQLFAVQSIQLIQCFYRVRAHEIRPVAKRHGFQLARITSRGTEIYPTMGDFEKRDVDRFRLEIDPSGPLADAGFQLPKVQAAIMAIQSDMAACGWIIAETMLNRAFIDGEGPKAGVEISGVSIPYAKGLGTDYASEGAASV